jgi:hypothetical protein
VLVAVWLLVVCAVVVLVVVVVIVVGNVGGVASESCRKKSLCSIGPNKSRQNSHKGGESSTRTSSLLVSGKHNVAGPK